MFESNHFARRESSGFVVDLHWDPADVSHEFRVEIVERWSGDGLVLFPRTVPMPSRRSTTRSRVPSRNRPAWSSPRLNPEGHLDRLDTCDSASLSTMPRHVSDAPSSWCGAVWA